MKRKASAVWKGSLKEGGGTISTETGVLRNAPADALKLFWDVDAPATLAELKANPQHLLRRSLPELDRLVQDLFISAEVQSGGLQLQPQPCGQFAVHGHASLITWFRPVRASDHVGPVDATVARIVGDPLRIHALVPRLERRDAIVELLARVGLPPEMADGPVNVLMGRELATPAVERTEG